jgi:hypothetical protein
VIGGRCFDGRVCAFSSRYPIPIIFSALLVFAMACLSLAAVVIGPSLWILAAIGLAAELSGIVLVVYAVVLRSDLLRVERETITMRWVDRA